MTTIKTLKSDIKNYQSYLSQLEAEGHCSVSSWMYRSYQRKIENAEQEIVNRRSRRKKVKSIDTTYTVSYDTYGTKVVTEAADTSKDTYKLYVDGIEMTDFNGDFDYLNKIAEDYTSMGMTAFVMTIPG